MKYYQTRFGELGINWNALLILAYLALTLGGWRLLQHSLTGE